MKTLFNTRVKENLANIVTILGLLVAIWLLVIAINNPEQLWSIFLLAGFVALTDFIDGRIARKFNISTYFGSILDRIRDRVFIYPALIILTWHYHWKLTNLPFITNTFTKALIIVVLGMEALASIAGCIGIIWYISEIKIDLNPSKWGKKKMFCGFTVVLIWFFSLTIEKYLGFPLIKFSIFVIDLGLVLMIYWAYRSLEEYFKRCKEEPETEKQN